MEGIWRSPDRREDTLDEVEVFAADPQGLLGKRPERIFRRRTLASGVVIKLEFKVVDVYIEPVLVQSQTIGGLTKTHKVRDRVFLRALKVEPSRFSPSFLKIEEHLPEDYLDLAPELDQ